MTVQLQGKVAVVTGASRGLGQRAAFALARHGARVALVARSEDQLRETERQIAASGGVTRVLPTDTSDARSIEDLKRNVDATFGVVSILVNAAGIFGPFQMIEASDPERWVETLMVNTIGPYRLCRAFMGGMIRQGWGRIINFSSAASLHPPGPLNSAYATSKVALNQFTRHLAAELAGTGVTANVIHPGDVKTDMWADIRDQCATMGLEAEAYQSWVRWVEKTGGDDPEKAAQLVLRLASDESAAITGQFLWIEDALQPPVPSWSDPSTAQPWRET